MASHHDQNQSQKASANMARDLELTRKASDESIRTEFCEGPILEVNMSAGPSPEHQASKETSQGTSDRADLIARIKRGESPTWVPNRKLEQAYHEPQDDTTQQAQRLASRPKVSSLLLPPIDLETSDMPDGASCDKSTKSIKIPQNDDLDRVASSSESNHLGSSLDGDDHTRSPQILAGPSIREWQSRGPFGTSPTTPWFSPPPHTRPVLQYNTRPLPNSDFTISSTDPLTQSRAPSLHSHSSSFVLKPPTSPLVQQSNNDDLDFSPTDLLDSPSKSSRRHTLLPHSLTWKPQSQDSRPHPFLGHEKASLSFHRHRARRSLTSNWSFQPASSPQTPDSRCRRPSITPEASPLQHATMVGSYEESILRGRMSTGPSKPLDFTAQIGALGKGDCKPKHPAHVTIPFPAVFYSWNTGLGRSPLIIDDEPSPYVGYIDIERSLPPAKPKEKRRRADQVTPIFPDEATMSDVSPKKHRDKRRRESSPAPKAPPGGSYRIPQQGHLQILIKNPNKTAVKLFFVPYDLVGMEAGSKTFIRQRCYSAGPALHHPIPSKSPSSSPNPTKTLASLVRNSRTLRYLIHINICCPSKGRFYLFQHIRVVFANRIPDDKEALQYEIQMPEPRYSPYKRDREPLPAMPSVAPKTSMPISHRRRSSGFGASLAPDTLEELSQSHSRVITSSSIYSLTSEGIPPVPSIPFDLVRSLQRPAPQTLRAEYSDFIEQDGSSKRSSSGVQSPNMEKIVGLAQRLGSSHSSSSTGAESFGKLNKGDAGYGGLFGRPGTPEPGEGLLARRLKGFGAGDEAGKAMGREESERAKR